MFGFGKRSSELIQRHTELQGKLAKEKSMVRELLSMNAEKGVVAPRVVLWDSTAPAGMGPGHVALSAADEALWGKVLGSLREEVGETAWGEYFTELWCFRDEKTGVLDIVAPSERSRSWLVSAYSAAIREAMVAHFGSAIGYTFSATEVTEEKGQKTS